MKIFPFGTSLVHRQSYHKTKINIDTMNKVIKMQIVKIFTAILLTTTTTPVHLFAARKPVKQTNDTLYRKISIQGNVQVILIQRQYEGLSYTDDNTGSVKVVKHGDLLRISGNSKAYCKLFLYVNDIYRIEAMDNVHIKTEGRLKTKFLQIFLKGNAKADIYTNTESLYTSISDNAHLKLSGSTTDHRQAIVPTPNLNLDDFEILDFIHQTLVEK